MSPETIETASDLLIGCWQRGDRITALPLDIRPASRAEGYAIQARLERLSAVPLFGWKIAATSVAGQAHIGVDGPLAGRLLAERVIPAGEHCPYGANQMQVAELEFAFRIGKDLPPRAEAYSVDAVLDAVATLHPAIEIPDSRLDPFESAGGPQLIADNACANYFKLGAAAPDSWRGIDLAAHRAACRINHGPEQRGVGSNVLGDPRIALTWIANELSALGITLATGQVVTTGTCVNPMKIAPGDYIFGDFGAIGTVSLTMTTS